MFKKMIFCFLFTTFGLANAASPCSTLAFNKMLPEAKQAVTVVCKKRFAVGYSVDQRTPLWVAEALTRAQFQKPQVPRRDNFRPDPSVPAILQPSEKEFVGTSFDKGHLAPFDDMSDDIVAADESFVLTNIVPQHKRLNRGIWKSLEGKIRKLAEITGSVYVVTGNIYSSSSQTLSGGTKIPSKMWKVFITPATKTVYVVVLPNEGGIKSADLYKYTMPYKKFQLMFPEVKVFPGISSYVDGAIG